MARGARYHPVADEGVLLRDVAAVIGRRLNVPVVSKTHEKADELFGWFANFAAADIPGSSQWTRERLGWQPKQAGPDCRYRPAALFRILNEPDIFVTVAEQEPRPDRQLG